MKIDEVHEYYGNFANISRALGVGQNAYQYWRKIGYIPYRAQLLIEKNTGGKLKASDPLKDMHNVRRKG